MNVSIAKVCPGFRNTDVGVNLFNPTMEVDGSAGVLEVVASVVNVDTVILVGQVSLYLVSSVPVHSKLVVHLLQGPLHLFLAGLDVVHLPH